MQWSIADYAQFLETLPDAALVVEGGERIVLANARAHALLGCQPGALLGKPLSIILPDTDRGSVAAELGRQLLGPDTRSREVSFRRMDSQPVAAVVRAQPLTLEGRAVALALLHDGGEEIRARDLLRTSEDRLRQALRVSRIGIFDHDQVTGVVYWSPEQRANYGWGAEEVVTLAKFLEQVHPGDRERIAAAVALAHDPSGPGIFDVEHRIIRRDGKVRWLTTRSQTLFAGEGAARRPVRTVGAVLDVTEEREAAEALRLFREASELATEAIFWLNRDAGFVYVNEAACRSLGYTREELLRLTLWDVDPVYPRSEWERRWVSFEHRQAPNTAAVETLHRRKDGSRFPVEVLGEHLHLAEGSIHIAYARDVTERRRAEEELRRSEARLSEAQRIARIGSWELDLVTNALTWSDEIFRIFEIDKSRFGASYEAFLETVHPEDRELVNRAYTESVKAHTRYAITHRLLLPDGRIKWVDEQSETSYDETGRPVRSVGTTQDVTERELAAAALRVKDQAIATGINAIAIADTSGRITYVNPAFVRMWGYRSEQEVIGRKPSDLAADEATVLGIVHKVQTEGAWQGDFVARRRDGSLFDAMLSASAVKDANGRIISMMGSFLDVTERNRLESQLRQAQKMESVGRLAGGVAHDFNNLLTSITGHVELALLELRTTDPLHELLTEVQRAAESAANLTRQLLAFSRKQVIDPRVLNLNQTVTRLQKMLQRLIREDIDLQVVLDPNLGQIRADPGQLEQVLVNLAVNARDAMPGGGKLTVETANITLDAEYVRAHPHTLPGAYVMLAVSDEGIGMSREVKSHLFEPFFTTKEHGKGTGLGLAMVYGAVKQNRGSIEVYSEPDNGTTIKIFLPRVEEVPEPQAVVSTKRLPTGSEAILLVEDELSVRAVAVRLLSRQGYTVHAFGSGVEAVRAVEGMTGPLHLLITDVVLPGMNGRILAQQIKALRPSINVLYTSGYSENVVIHHGVLDRGIEFIAKPYSIELLARRVREVLDSAG